MESKYYGLSHVEPSKELDPVLDEVIEIIVENADSIEFVAEKIIDKFGQRMAIRILERILKYETTTIDFDGVDDYVMYSDIDMSAKDIISINSEFYPQKRKSINSYMTILSIENKKDQQCMSIRIPCEPKESDLEVILPGKSDNCNRIKGPSVDYEIWQNMNIEIDNSIMKICVDSREKSDSISVDLCYNVNNLKLGMGSYGYYYRGKIDFLTITTGDKKSIVTGDTVQDSGTNTQNAGVRLENRTKKRDVQELKNILLDKLVSEYKR